MAAPRVDPRSAELLRLFNEAVAHHGAGRLPEARLLYERLLERLPNHPELLDRYGTLRHQLGDHAAALGFVERSVARRPGMSGAWNHLGSILRAVGRGRAAAAGFRRAAMIDPSAPEPLINLGILAAAAGDDETVVRTGRHALSIRPGLVEVQVRSAAALLALGLPDDALGLLLAARRAEPLRADLALHLPPALAATGRRAAALDAARCGIAAFPATHELYPSLFLSRDPGAMTGDFVEWSRRAVRLRPDRPMLRANHAAELYRAGAFDAALREARRACVLGPSDRPALQNLLVAACLGRRYAWARRLAGWSLAAYPGASFALFALAEIEMAIGDLGRAWELYEARFGRPEYIPKLELPRPWAGPGSPVGRLLVVTEQGIGDELLFLSCLPDLLQDVPDPVVELDARFIPLYRRSFPGVDFIPRQFVRGSSGQPVYDYARVIGRHGVTHHVHNGSLPRFYRNDRTRPPTRDGYLAADRAGVEAWRERLAEVGPEPKVGICWRSILRTPARSISYAPLELWDAVLSLPGIRFVSLQYDECRAEVDAVRKRIGVDIWVPEGLDQLNDLDGTAALISALDAVLSTATSVCMLAAALGMPTYRIGPSTHSIGRAHDHFFPNMIPLVPWSVDRQLDVAPALARAAEILPGALARLRAGGAA